MITAENYFLKNMQDYFSDINFTEFNKNKILSLLNDYKSKIDTTEITVIKKEIKYVEVVKWLDKNNNECRKVLDLDAEKVFKHFCQIHNVEPSYLTMKEKNSERIKLRQMCMYILKITTIKSLKEIGDMFDGKDHTTVLYAINCVKHRIKTEKDLENTIQGMVLDIQHFISEK